MRRFARILVCIAVVAAPLTVLGGTENANAGERDCYSVGYACTPGYTGGNAAGTWAWAYYGASNAQVSNGYHNCTLYAAWRLQQSGMNNAPGNWGHAVNWASAIGGGNHTAAVGSIAWWGASRGGGLGHVAYVEQVSGSNVFIRADNWYNPGYTNAGWIPASSVELFLHPHDIATGNPLAEGNFINLNGNIYRIAGGAPIYVQSWDAVGGPQAYSAVTQAQFDSLRQYPADGTFVVVADNSVYRFAGGAPLPVTNWDAAGYAGEPVTRIDTAAINGADGPPPWNHIRQYPADGTELRGGPAGAFYRVLAGVAEPVASATNPTVIDQAAIDNAGAGGVWNHLKAPTPPDPVDSVALTVTGQLAYSASGPVATGGFDISKNRDGSLHGVSGTATLPNGAEFSVRATQFWILPMFTGTTTLSDTSASVSLNTPIIFGKVAMQANTVSAAQGWFDLRSWPWKSYNLRWTIIDS